MGSIEALIDNNWDDILVAADYQKLLNEVRQSKPLILASIDGDKQVEAIKSMISADVAEKYGRPFLNYKVTAADSIRTLIREFVKNQGLNNLFQIVIDDVVFHDYLFYPEVKYLLVNALDDTATTATVMRWVASNKDRLAETVYEAAPEWINVIPNVKRVLQLEKRLDGLLADLYDSYRRESSWYVPAEDQLEATVEQFRAEEQRYLNKYLEMTENASELILGASDDAGYQIDDVKWYGPQKLVKSVRFNVVDWRQLVFMTYHYVHKQYDKFMIVPNVVEEATNRADFWQRVSEFFSVKFEFAISPEDLHELRGKENE